MTPLAPPQQEMIEKAAEEIRNAYHGKSHGLGESPLGMWRDLALAALTASGLFEKLARAEEVIVETRRECEGHMRRMEASASDHFWALETNYLKQIAAMTETLDAVATATGCSEWGYPGQIVRDVASLRASLLAAEKAGAADRARLILAREALLSDGYFTPEQVGDDIAPRILERVAALRTSRDTLREAARRYMVAMEGFADAVRQDSGLSYPWPAQDEQRAALRTALGGSNE